MGVPPNHLSMTRIFHKKHPAIGVLPWPVGPDPSDLAPFFPSSKRCFKQRPAFGGTPSQFWTLQIGDITHIRTSNESNSFWGHQKSTKNLVSPVSPVNGLSLPGFPVSLHVAGPTHPSISLRRSAKFASPAPSKSLMASTRRIVVSIVGLISGPWRVG